MLAVGDMRPGIFPIMFAVKMKMPIVPTSGRYSRPFGPMLAFIMSRTAVTMSSSTIWSLPGFSTDSRDRRNSPSATNSSTMIPHITRWSGIGLAGSANVKPSGWKIASDDRAEERVDDLDDPE